MARDFVVCQVLAAVADQSVLGEAEPRLENHTGGDQLSPLSIGDPKTRGLAHGGVVEDDGLDFAAVDVFAASDDHVFQAIQYVEIALGVAVADVARPKEAVSKCRRRIFLVVPVPARDVGAPRHKLAMLPGLQHSARFVRHLYLDARTGSPA